MPLEAPLQTGASRAAHSSVARVIHMRTLLAFLALTAPAFAQSGESPYIFGLHDNGGENNMADMGKKGWILFTERLGKMERAVRGLARPDAAARIADLIEEAVRSR